MVGCLLVGKYCEVIGQFKLDMFSVGVILFIMVQGIFPFSEAKTDVVDRAVSSTPRECHTADERACCASHNSERRMTLALAEICVRAGLRSTLLPRTEMRRQSSCSSRVERSTPRSLPSTRTSRVVPTGARSASPSRQVCPGTN